MTDDLRAKVFRDREHAEDWRVEKYDEEGGCEITSFSGPAVQERARCHADREYGQKFARRPGGIGFAYKQPLG